MSAVVETTLRPQAVDMCMRLADNVRTTDIQVRPAPRCFPIHERPGLGGAAHNYLEPRPRFSN